MYSYLDVFKARVQEARDAYEKDLRDEGDKPPPSASPTTFSDCASLFDRSALAYRVARELRTMAMFDQAAASAALGAELETAALSCDASASGKIIEV